MNRKLTRLAVAGAAALGLAAIGGAAFAAPGDPIEPGEPGTVVLDLDAPEIPEEGALWMTVADDQETLVENGSTATELVFTGTLPDVTVTDTRADVDVPADGVAMWYVTGVAEDFVHENGIDTIDAAQLGWEPALAGDYDADEVYPGEPVDSSLDGGDGLVDPASDLLVWTWDSAHPARPGSWTANAGLTLKTPPGITPGHYEANLTLTLMENPF